MAYSYKAIIFDCDGVIVDTETLSNRILKSLLIEQGLHLDDKTLHAQFTGFTNQENLANAEKLLGRALPVDFDANYRQQFHNAINNKLTPIKGVLQLLEKIQVPIAMATNARREEMEFKLHKIQLSQRFATRFCVEDVKNGKPAPDLYLKAAAALSVLPKDCLVIEDSVAGIGAGRAAGMKVLAFSESVDKAIQLTAGASECFDSMAELETLLGL
ncbi:HAD family phosphatase [Marinomonas sp. A79]|uniref:HAD family phosphatase n=1 Tax=Marinomonas vulgaris TaxID=2823372 RepID=A0ABS5HA39_9GAMM|nr:HAD family phosphatase [Marinomonas vulgaris]MBR7887894.1 HAD family phosphatase [Marinomonas vulgaris]